MIVLVTQRAGPAQVDAVPARLGVRRRIVRMVLGAVRRDPMVEAQTKGMAIHDQLGYPVLDTDGHVLELGPVFSDFCRARGAGALVDAVPMLRRHRDQGHDTRANLSAEE